jgi:RHS repeat-associated protein
VQGRTQFTGQRKDETGLHFYNARLYHSGLGLFVSADSIVPGTASGKGGAAESLGYDGRVALAPLTVDFHEPGFLAEANAENAFTLAKGFFDADRKPRTGPANPQALNRYSYVLNNPVRYTDPTGHQESLGLPSLLTHRCAGTVCRITLGPAVLLAIATTMAKYGTDALDAVFEVLLRSWFATELASCGCDPRLAGDIDLETLKKLAGAALLNALRLIAKTAMYIGAGILLNASVNGASWVWDFRDGNVRWLPFFENRPDPNPPPIYSCPRRESCAVPYEAFRKHAVGLRPSTS